MTEEVSSKLSLLTHKLAEVREHRGYGLVGKLDTAVDKAEESHSYFY